MKGTIPKVVSRDEMAIAAERARDAGETVVFTNGVFDILHIGHVRYLADAANLGTRLFVGVNSDSSVRRLKGQDRPINGQRERAELLAALSVVDLVSIFGDDLAVDIVSQVKPSVYVKGGDYSDDPAEPDFPRGLYPPEGRVVTAYGGLLRILPFVAGYSTSDTVARIREQTE
jgi:D-glycero-beta-D-manno-heptose 1-phosphate adenylyltransferase